MFKIPKQEYTAEFKESAVKRVKSGQGIGAVARDLGLVEQTLRNWVKAAKAGKLNPPDAKRVTPEQMELSRLRAENARLRMECEILQKKRRRTSRRMRCEVRLDRHAAQVLSAARDVRGACGEPQRLPGVEAWRTTESKVPHRCADACPDSVHSQGVEGGLRVAEDGS